MNNETANGIPIRYGLPTAEELAGAIALNGDDDEIELDNLRIDDDEEETPRRKKRTKKR